MNYLFSGQGAQYPGMMKEIYDRYDGAKKIFRIADETLGRSISGLCFQGTQEELNLTHNTQPCVLAADLAAFAATKMEGFLPDAVAGFSLGEYAALVAANVLSVEDAFRIIQIRADAMQEAVPVGKGAMAAIMKLNHDEVVKLCDEAEGYVIPANINSPSQIVVSGESSAVDHVMSACKEKKIRAVKLPVSAPFHCELMEPARQKLEEVFRKTEFRDATIPVYMNVDGKRHSDAEDIKNCLLRQTVSPVEWIKTIENMSGDFGETFIELGPGNTLVKFVMKISQNAVTANIEDVQSISIAKESFSKDIS